MQAPVTACSAPRAVDRRVLGGQARVEVVRVAVLADHDAGVLDGAGRVEELGADRRGRGVLLRVAHQRLEPARPRLGVVVEEDERLAAAPAAAPSLQARA